MATKAQTAANRRNARKSTGPKTPEGKAASSMNSLRHGLRARSVLLPGEDREEFEQLLAALQDQYQPQTPAEQHLVDQAAIAQWKLVRAEVFQARSYAEDPSPKASNAMFSHMTLVTGRLERTFLRAYKELERIKAAREKEREEARKSQEPEKPVGIDLYWIDPETGERTLAAQTPRPGVTNYPDLQPQPPSPAAPGEPNPTPYRTTG